MRERDELIRSYAVKIQTEIDKRPEPARDAFSHTLGDFVSAVMTITTEAEALQFFEGHVVWLQRQQPRTLEEACEAARANIGWVFGEGMRPALRAMWNKICGAQHPVFGVTSPSLGEALQAGMDTSTGGVEFAKKELARRALLKKPA